MRIYRVVWTVVAACVLLVALLCGLVVVGWMAVLGISAALALLGASFGLAVPKSEGGIVSVGAGAAWAAASGVMIVGLPVLISGWSLLVLFVLAVTAPGLIGMAVAARARRRALAVPDRGPLRLLDMTCIPDEELTARWLAAGAKMAHPGCLVERRLALAEERGLLLDEIERRDVAGFPGWLSRQDWKVPQGH